MVRTNEELNQPIELESLVPFFAGSPAKLATLTRTVHGFDMAVFRSQDKQWERAVVVLLGTLTSHVVGEIRARPSAAQLLETSRRYSTSGANSFRIAISQQELGLDVPAVR
jgi:hypothetical protein